MDGTVSEIEKDNISSGEELDNVLRSQIIRCENKESINCANDSQASGTQDAIMRLDKAISRLEMQLAAARAAKEGNNNYPIALEPSMDLSDNRPKVYFVMGIITAFSSRSRRESIRRTWMPQRDKLQKLEKEKGIVMRFVIGHSATPGDVLDHAIDAEVMKYNDFIILNHVEGYHGLSMKTQAYFSTALAIWDAEFYIKVDDDVHVNIATIGSVLARHTSKPRVYMGCMKSGPVLSKQGVKYYEPEHWKFGQVGNKYFRHAAGQLYAISKDLAVYISVNRNLLHKYANEDVSLGSWFIGLHVEHVDERRLCCGTPPDCEWKNQTGNACAASFDWECNGICKSAERMEEVHRRCGEGEEAIWNTIY